MQCLTAPSPSHWFHVLLCAITGGFDFDHLSSESESSIHVLGLMRQLALRRRRIVFDIELPHVSVSSILAGGEMKRKELEEELLRVSKELEKDRKRLLES